jgi:peptidyl-prolyl cis-trans isomerase SDCCAG10
MASSGANTNQSQFFITLGPAEFINKKHTIFGKVTGDTIFNLMSMNLLECEHDDRPSNPPK